MQNKKYIVDIDACIDFEMLKVKVHIIFLGTVGFVIVANDQSDIKVHV